MELHRKFDGYALLKIPQPLKLFEIINDLVSGVVEKM